MGARERGGKTVAKPIPNADGRTATEFAAATVTPGTTVYTDESSIYSRLPFDHDAVNHSAKEYVRGAVHTNGIESVWAVLKRSIHGTWHHVSPKHLHRYVNEASMRLNGAMFGSTPSPGWMPWFGRGVASVSDIAIWSPDRPASCRAQPSHDDRSAAQSGCLTIF